MSSTRELRLSRKDGKTLLRLVTLVGDDVTHDETMFTVGHPFPDVAEWSVWEGDPENGDEVLSGVRDRTYCETEAVRLFFACRLL